MKKRFELLLLIVFLILLISVIVASFVNSLTPSHPLSLTSRDKQTAIPGKLSWSDEFNGAYGATPDPTKWGLSTGGSGWGNKQLQYYTSTNAILDGQGSLLIKADNAHSQHLHCWYGTCQYVSARLTTARHFSFTYGELDAVITIPRGKGIWSAFWLAGANCAVVGFPACGEIDIAESKGDGTVIESLHGPGLDQYMSYGRFGGSPHRYTLRWSPDSLNLLVDGTLKFTESRSQLGQRWVFDHPFYIILDVAVGGQWPGSPDTTTIFPQYMQVQYVRLTSL